METITVTDPASGETLATLEAASPADVDRVLRAARAAFDTGPWPRTAPAERETVLQRIAQLIDAEATPLAELETRDVGKPLHEAEWDVAEAAAVFRYYAGWPTKLAGDVESVGWDRLVYVEQRPIGVVGAIVPWNFPLVMAAYKIAPALAAGCCVVLKPAELTPLTTLRLAAIAREAGLPDGVLQIVVGHGPVAGAALAAHPLVDKIAFTGSTAVGTAIAAAAAPNVTRVSLELGGKSAQLVFDDADLERAVEGVMRGMWVNAGQVCVAGSRLLVQREVHDELLKELAIRTQALRVGPGLDRASEMGPLVSETQRTRVAGYIETAVAEGADVVTGRGQPAGSGWFLEPTILAGVEPGHTVFREEVFGPVLTVTPFGDEAEAVALAEATPYGLAAGVWTRDAARLHRVARRMRVGTVWANTYGEFHPNVSFGGTKASGIGRELGRAGINAYLEPTSTIVSLEA